MILKAGGRKDFRLPRVDRALSRLVNVTRPTLLRYFGSVVAVLEFRFGA
jgi:hypothetical protein